MKRGLTLATLSVALMLPARLHAQITAGNTSSAKTSVGGATTLTWSHIVPSGTNRILVVSTMSDVVNVVDSVKYSGVSLTLVGRKSASGVVEIWRLLAPAVGTANVVAYFHTSQQTVAGAVDFNGVSQTTPTGTFVSSSGTSNAPTLNVSSAAGDVAISALWGNDGPTASVTGVQTLKWTDATGSTSSTIRGAVGTAAGAASVTMSWSLSASQQWAEAGVSLQAAAVGTTTLATGTDPGNTSLAPGGAATMADAFTLQTSSGTDGITAVTVTLATGTSGGLGLVEITDNAGSTVYGSVSNPGSDTPAITLSGLTATTTLTAFKIRVTPKSHAAMPVPAGASYAVTAFISAWTGSNTHAGSDAGGTTVTIDNLSPGSVTSATATSGNAQVPLAWTNPGDADLASIVALRRTVSVVTDVPVEGTTYTVGNTIGSSTVACVVAAPATTCTNTGLTNGTTYYFKLFAVDANGNYSAVGTTPTGSPVTPVAPPVVGSTNVVSPSGTRPPGTDLVYTVTLTNTGGSNATSLVLVDSLKTNVDFKLGTVTSNMGTSGLTATVAYSNNGALSFVYTPVSAGGGAPAGYDRAVTHVRWTFTGALSQTSPNNTVNVGLTARIR